MGMSKARRARAVARQNGKATREEVRRNAVLDKLAEFEVFDATILPQLRRMVLENWSPDKIRKAFAPMMQAIMVKKGLEGNFKAVKDTLDRYEGTAVQRVETKNLYAQMSKKELAALALQKLLDAKIIDTTGRVIREVKQLKNDDSDT